MTSDRSPVSPLRPLRIDRTTKDAIPSPSTQIARFIG